MLTQIPGGRVETLPLGAHVLLHNPVSAAMVLADPAEAGWLTDAAVPDPEHVQTLAGWRAAGLFDDRPYPPDDPVPLGGAAPQTRLVFAGPAGGVALDLPEDMLAQQLRALLGFCLSSGDTSRSYHFVAGIEADTYSAYDGLTPLTETIPLDAARFLAARLVCEAVTGAAASFHAAAVAHQGRGLLLVGESGRGKTTTALGLLAAGMTQLADDHVALDASGRLCAFPGAIGMKPGTEPLAEAQALLQDGREAAPVRGGVRYVIAPRRAATGAPCAPAAVVFPEFTPDFPSDASPEMIRIPPEEALVRVIGAGARVARGFGSAAPLAAFLNEVPCWRMVYSGSHQSVPACQALLA